jgi:ubiquinone/menaquinone biosynthesis C-methylase UbiE
LAALKLHETFRGPDWREVRLDINPGAAPDIVASMTDMPMVPSGAFDAVYSSHNLEHLAPHELAPALKEFYRVLKPQGFALISLPDLQQVAEYIAAGRAEETVKMTNKGPITPLDILYGFRPLLAGNPFMAHKFGYTAETLKAALQEAGFAHITVERDGEFNLWAVVCPMALPNSL